MTAHESPCRGQRRPGDGLRRRVAAALVWLVLPLWATGPASAETHTPVDALMQSLPYRNEPAWHDDLLTSLSRLNETGEVFAAVPALLAALTDRNVATRRGAARALAEISRRWGWQEQPSELRSALIAALQDRDEQVREGAVEALGGIRPIRTVEPALMVALDDADPRVRWAAVRSLTGWDRSESIADSLVPALSDPDTRVRIAAAVAIQRFEAAAGRAMPALVERFRAGGPAARVAVAEQLQFFWYTAFRGEAGDGIIRLYATMLDDPEIRIRQIGAGSLSRLVFIAAQQPAGAARPETGWLVPRLAASLSDRDPVVRTAAAWALRSLGRTAAPALDALESALGGETDSDASWAMRMAREVIANRLDRDEARTALVPRNDWYDQSLCLPYAAAALAGLRPGDAAQKVHDLLGEPGRVTAGESEDDGGGYIVYTYHYPDHYPGLEVDIARDAVERLSTTSPAMPTGRGLHAGLTRQEVLALFGAVPSTEAMTTQRFTGYVCDTVFYDTMYLRLTFGEAGVLDRIEWVMEGP